MGGVARLLPSPEGEESRKGLGDGSECERKSAIPPYRAVEQGWQPISRSRVIGRSDQSGLNGPGVEV
jgi:hypothetical protein